ncbi:MAG: C45 family autoproteolytic acyltransferase/hydrolase [Armatimonadota bacterium]
MDIVVGEGSALQIGRAHGEQLAGAVAANVRQFWMRMHESGWDRQDTLVGVRAAERLLSDDRRAEITGIAEGARVAYLDLVSFNVYHAWAYPDGCTVMWALPDATADGRMLFFKTSDKIGRSDMLGEGFYMNKEINVVLALRPAGKPAIVGVGSAGSTGLKMGLNDRGVAAGTNIARTKELRDRRVTTTQERAVDRVQLARDGLEMATAMDAGQAITARVADAPMATPGNLEFVDPTLAYVIEGSYDRLAVQLYHSGTGSRANRFVVLHDLNDPGDVSSYCRYVRTQELLKGKTPLSLDDFAAFTRDHANGPGPNSICRHDPDIRSETTQSAFVAAVDPASPADSVVRIALGKPCHAWRYPDGHLEITMRVRSEDIPEGFRTGDVWKRYWTEAPLEPEPAAAS